MPRPPAFAMLSRQYLAELDAQMLSTGTLKTYRYALSIAEQWIRQGHAPESPKKWEPSDVRTFWDSQKGVRSATQRLRLTVLLGFLKWCGNTSCINIRLKIRVQRSQVRWLSHQQIGQLIAEAKFPPVRAAIVAMAYTGMRSMELCDLRWSNVTEKNIIVVGKGLKERSIPLSPQFWEAMQYYLKWLGQRREDLFLVNSNMEPYQPKRLQQLIIDHGNRTGIKSSCHDYRRSYGQHLYRAEYPIEKIQKIMGHEKIDQTIQYLGIEQYDFKDVTDYLPNYQKMYLEGQSQI